MPLIAGGLGLAMDPYHNVTWTMKLSNRDWLTVLRDDRITETQSQNGPDPASSAHLRLRPFLRHRAAVCGLPCLVAWLDCEPERSWCDRRCDPPINDVSTFSAANSAVRGITSRLAVDLPSRLLGPPRYTLPRLFNPQEGDDHPRNGTTNVPFPGNPVIRGKEWQEDFPE